MFERASINEHVDPENGFCTLRMQIEKVTEQPVKYSFTNQHTLALWTTGQYFTRRLIIIRLKLDKVNNKRKKKDKFPHTLPTSSPICLQKFCSLIFWTPIILIFPLQIVCRLLPVTFFLFQYEYWFAKTSLHFLASRESSYTRKV